VSYMFWLGIDGEPDDTPPDNTEADGFITIHPQVPTPPSA
jgi:hypothetical protein